MKHNNKMRNIVIVGIAAIAAYGLFFTDAGQQFLDQSGTSSGVDLGFSDSPAGTSSCDCDITIGFDHIDKLAGVALTDDTDVDVDVYTKRADGTYKLAKHSTSGSAIVPLESSITSVYLRPTVPDNDFYFDLGDSMSHNRVIGADFLDITGDGTDEFVLEVDVTRVDQLGEDDNGNPKFTITLSWLDYTIPTSFLNVGGDKDYGVGTGSQQTDKTINLLLTEGDSVGLKSLEFNFNSTVGAAEWEESDWCFQLEGDARRCLDDLDRDKFSTTTVYTHEYGTDFNDLKYIEVPLGGDTTPELDLDANSTFGSAADGYAVTITATYKEADGDTLTTNTIEVYTVVG